MNEYLGMEYTDQGWIKIGDKAYSPTTVYRNLTVYSKLHAELEELKKENNFHKDALMVLERLVKNALTPNQSKGGK